MKQEISREILNTIQPLNRQLIRINDQYMTLYVYWILWRSGKTDILLSKRNKHSFFELQFMLAGQINQQIETKEGIVSYTVKDSQFIIVPRNAYHVISNASPMGTRFCVAFDIETHDPYIKAVMQEINNIRVYDAPELSSSYIEMMLKVSNSVSPWVSKEISNLLQCMIFQLFDVIFPKDETVVERDIKPTKSMYVMEEINKYIANYIRDGITVEDVAVSMSLSSRQLNRICHKHAGKSLNKLINDEKLKFIKELIATTTLSFADIAHVAGFSSEYALNRFFKYAEGYTLGQYKKLAKL